MGRGEGVGLGRFFLGLVLGGGERGGGGVGFRGFVVLVALGCPKLLSSGVEQFYSQRDGGGIA